MIWTEVEDQIIVANRGTLSAAIIANLIGHGCTRNAVIGRINRLKLPKIKHAMTGGNPRKVKPRRVNGEHKVRKAPTIQLPPPMPVAPLNIPFIDLERNHCREIVGSGGIGMSLSCGHTVITDSSYCRWHHSINYTTPERKAVATLAA
jgi:hypothetical protein